jgi:ABC-type phosphate transport system permease subunit
MSKSDNTHERKTARREATQMALAAPTAVLLIPLIFWLQYGVINGFAWGLAAFLAAICLLTAVGIYFKPHSEYHSPVPLHGGIGDAIGSFWLISCVLGILVSWFVSERTIFPEDSWKSIYRDWVLFSIVLPLVTAVPLFRYLRGRSILIGLPLLLIITLIPVWMAAGAASDLLYGPVERLIPGTDQWELYLQYTGRSLGLIE